MPDTYMGLPLNDPKVVGILAYQWGLPADCVADSARPGYDEAAAHDTHRFDVAERNAGRGLMTMQEALGLTEDEVLELCTNGHQLAGYRDELHERVTSEPGYDESIRPYLY